MSALGERMRARRKALGWTLRELSELTTISVSCLGSFERGARNPSDTTAALIARQLDLPASELVGRCKLSRSGNGHSAPCKAPKAPFVADVVKPKVSISIADPVQDLLVSQIKGAALALLTHVKADGYHILPPNGGNLRISIMKV